MYLRARVIALLVTTLFGVVRTGTAGTLVGHVRDENWFARYQANPFGVGYYEYAVNGTAVAAGTSAGAASTDVFGGFQMPSLPAGVYNVGSWDVWWRSAFQFDV